MSTCPATLAAMTKDAEAVERGHAIFDPIAEEYLERDGVDMGRMFASEGLRVRGKIFSLLSFTGDLMLKLPAARTTELIDAGDAERVEMGGRAMREWVFVPIAKPELWRPLVGEAYAYLDEITP